MTEAVQREYRALVLGDVWEVDDIFNLELFNERFPVEVIYVDDVENFRQATEQPEIDLIIIDVEPYGMEVLEHVLESPPMRPVIMVGDSANADIILEAKRRGLKRYVIRLEDDQVNIELLCQEIKSVFEQLVQPPEMTYPTVEDLFRYAQFHNVRQPFLIVDLHRHLLYINQSGVEMVDRLHNQKAELGSSLDHFFLDESIEEFSANLDRAFEGEELEVDRTFEALPEDQKHRKLSYQPVRRAGSNVVAVSIACRNVGARRQAEEELEQRQQALWSYFDTMPLPLQVIDEDLSVERCNSSFLELLSLNSADSIKGHSVDGFIHPDDREDFRDAVEQLMSGEETYVQTEHRYCDEQGLVVWVNHIGFSVDEREERPTNVLMVAVDVTRQKEAEQRAEQSMRMEAIGELAGGVAHDFNNVLAIVTALGHTLKEQLEAKHEDKLVKHVDKMQQAIESGASLTHQLLSFSQKRSIDKQLIDLNHRLRETGDLLDRALGGAIEMHLDLATDLAPIEVGKGQLDQVSMNLVVNARDAMPDGGTLRISTRQARVEANEPPPRPDLEPGDWVVLEIADTGVGMDRETRKRIFDPFYTTKAAGKGTGMGLATVYRIVEGSGGKIYVDSEPGDGSTFTIYLPASEQVEPQTTQAQGAPSEAATQPASAYILLVEDEEDIREPYALFLRHSGYEVLEAGGVQEARTAAEQADHPIDLLLADVILPDGSGVDLAKELQEDNVDMNIIFVSGYAPDLIYRGERDLDERWGFLPKPVTRDKLLSTVDEVVTRGN